MLTPLLLLKNAHNSPLSLYTSPSSHHRPDVASVQKCSIDNLKSDLSFLDGAKPIQTAEFILRRDRLAQALAANKVDAFVLEPGYTFQYYGNVSQQDWEPWEPEERPFLMLIMPQVSPNGSVSAKTAFLSPHFEEGRVRMLGIPSRDDAELDIVVWEEHWNPYTTLLGSRLFAGSGDEAPTLMIDEEMRDFIVRGLTAASFRTVGLSPEAELVRQQKTAAEVEILRAVNTGTVAAVRAMRPCLVPDLTEDQVTTILDQTLLSIGFGLFFDIVLFEEHGALPHGGFVTGGKKLTYDSMVVIDVGAHYLGYSSDICRSFMIDPPPGRRRRRRAQQPPADSLRAEKEKVWRIVLDAQTAAAKAMRPNGTAASVDIAARTVIEGAGYGYGFTHRLGHGIGIKAHESPYLNKWNTGSLLKPGMTFTNEPGIYLEGKFGVRHEDVYLVTEDGEAELLTGQRARGIYEP
ncbi:Prolidase/Aminopeptidase P-like protein [Trichoderma reesei QM6a]|jgi:Xaa-Pro aminopeptidase|uniref:Prolidase/Aminopeptidase P-like protein n=2 Tax=Hypocrea jecorina TaxID=51453 RepID=G0RIN6_HYPJQ|nr:Prolidase/Aminopeptidase P-like protein [Trichoderma reesei QM6a]EGR49239.1 Prolidase/Aminopeptidase P-like protein [Trichoderma reesei QM6a]ETS02296.1 Creatinase/aminopeptidase [Trichoderma reesei RUT C-30]